MVSLRNVWSASGWAGNVLARDYVMIGQYSIACAAVLYGHGLSVASPPSGLPGSPSAV